MKIKKTKKMIQCENHENHKKFRIRIVNNENYENLRILFENH